MHLRLQGGAARLQLVEFLLQAGGLQPVGDGVHEVGELALDRLQVAGAGHGLRASLDRAAVPFPDKGGTERRHQVGLHQLCRELLKVLSTAGIKPEEMVFMDYANCASDWLNEFPFEGALAT